MAVRICILRLEDEEGFGVFSVADQWAIENIADQHKLPRRRTKAGDGRDTYHSAFRRPHQEDFRQDWFGMHCAFRDERQLRRWFPQPMLEYLDRQGIKAVTYIVPEDAVLKGRDQWMFDRSRAVKFETMEPSRVPLQ